MSLLQNKIFILKFDILKMKLLLVNFLLTIILFTLAKTTGSRSVTYPGIGTFTTSDFYHPIFRPLGSILLPESPEAIGPRFLLFTRANRYSEVLVTFNSSSDSLERHFNASAGTKVLIHGFHNKVDNASWTVAMKDRWLDYEDLNVLIVDWGLGASGLYHQAIANARVVGAMVAIQIQYLVDTFGGSSGSNLNLTSFHLLGHSLGAHVSGYAGKRLLGQLGQISGLDPAGPLFEGLPPEGRLWRTDAHFVDVLHTDALFEGMIEPVGTIDFYPNGGVRQPGCIRLEGLLNAYHCNHYRAHMLYVDALSRRVKVQATRCSNYLRFRLGRCEDCEEEKVGADGFNSTTRESCRPLIGPRAIEWKGRVVTPGLRYYLDSRAQRPLFG